MNTGDMEKYCPKPHPVYFNAFSMWQQLSGSVQYLIKDCIKELKDLRSDIQNYSEHIFQHSCRLAARSDVSVTVPCICQRQQHRMNQQSDSPERLL